MTDQTNRPAALLLAERILARPHLIHAPQGEAIARLLVGRAAGLAASVPTSQPPARGYMVQDGVAVIPIVGTLIQRGSWLEAECPLVSYSTLKRKIAEALAALEVRAILLDVDSPGGEAAGLFTFARWLLGQRGVKPIWSVANEFCASAAYAIACCADHMVAPAQAEIGSIGVWSYHVDVSGADEQAGHKYTAIAAGERKGDLWPHAPLSKEALESSTAMVQALYADFIALVAEARGLDAAVVRGTEAATMLAPQAQTLGLIDDIQSFDAAFAALVRASAAQSPSPPTATTQRKGNAVTKAAKKAPKAKDPEDDAQDPVELVEEDEEQMADDEDVEPDAEDDPTDDDDDEEPVTPAASAIALMGRATAAGFAGLGRRLANDVASRKMSPAKARSMLAAAMGDAEQRGAASHKGPAMSRLDAALAGRNPKLKAGGGGQKTNSHSADLAALIDRRIQK